MGCLGCLVGFRYVTRPVVSELAYEYAGSPDQNKIKSIVHADVWYEIYGGRPIALSSLPLQRNEGFAEGKRWWWRGHCTIRGWIGTTEYI